MGIGWLWYFTHSTDADGLRSANERRAATVYARWRAVLGWAAALGSRSRNEWDDRRRERAARRELHALPDHLLRDIGLWRDGIDGCVDGSRRSARKARRPSTTPRAVHAEAPVAPAAPIAMSATPAAPETSPDEAIDLPSRAA